ncbi:hypothetical protein AAFF_G00265300 [Aldrovandia affinis]|uniref:Ig-like domain-containing protein n=1 Tax=Aldrovandia affinis TaxID=143900 RepID=A0AAD7RBT4_9TELE|nr:hypothetical protein AAFF_G00265300 [Aldrovandia affinis]
MTRIFLVCLLFCVTGLGVFSVQTVELNGIVGQSVTFPDAVKNMGSLSYGVNKDKQATVGDVTGGKFTPFRDRVQWDSSTGRFSITDLNKEDSGMYTVVNNDAAGKPYQYQLNVYKRERQKSYASSPVRSAPDAYLPETVDEGGVYTCEAKNSVSRETAKLTVGDHCTGQRVNLDEVTCGLCREEVMMYTTTSLQHSGEHGRTAALSSQTGDVDVFLLLTRNLE